jgi:hypothetical protein
MTGGVSGVVAVGNEKEVAMPQILHMGTPLALFTALAGACGGSNESRQAGAESGATDSVAAAAAARSAEPRVSNVMIGSQMGAGGRISVPSFEFTPQDTVCGLATTEGVVEGEAHRGLAAEQRGPQQSAESVRPRGERVPPSQPKGFKRGPTRSGVPG